MKTCIHTTYMYEPHMNVYESEYNVYRCTVIALLLI